MTFGYSLKLWEKSNALERESRQFNFMSDHYGLKYWIITYGDNSDKKYENYFNNAKIIPIYSIFKESKWKIVNILKSFFFPLKLVKEIEVTKFVVKQNQLLGSWVSIIFKKLTHSSLYIRTGYDMYTFSIHDQKSKIKIFLYRAVTYLSLLFSDIYTVSSKVDYDFIIENFRRINPNKIKVLHNWVDISSINEFSKKEISIISVGRLELQKNFSHLIRELKGSNFKITIFGEGSLEEEIKLLARELEVDLVLLPTINNKELLHKLKTTRFFILSSLYEGNPKVLLEAMSSGCIVLGSNIPNNTEIINDGVDGFVFDLKKNDLNEKFKDIVNLDDNKLNQISINAQEKISQKYGKEHILEQELQIFSKLGI